MATKSILKLSIGLIVPVILIILVVVSQVYILKVSGAGVTLNSDASTNARYHDAELKINIAGAAATLLAIVVVIWSAVLSRGVNRDIRAYVAIAAILILIYCSMGIVASALARGLQQWTF